MSVSRVRHRSSHSNCHFDLKTDAWICGTEPVTAAFAGRPKPPVGSTTWRYDTKT